MINKFYFKIWLPVINFLLRVFEYPIKAIFFMAMFGLVLILFLEWFM